MADPQLIITDAGRAAAVTAAANEISIDITQVAIGTGQWTPTAAATALQAELKRLPASGSQKSTPTSVTVGFQDSSADAYEIYEVGFYLSDGTLLAIYASVDTLVAEKSAPLRLLWGLTLALSSLPADSISVTATANFIPPNAGESVAGIAELATQEEVNDGEDDLRIVTSKKLKEVLLSGPYLWDLIWGKKLIHTFYYGNEINDFTVRNSCATFQNGASQPVGTCTATVTGHPTGSGTAITDFIVEKKMYELVYYDVNKRSGFRCAMLFTGVEQWSGFTATIHLHGVDIFIDTDRSVHISVRFSGVYSATGIVIGNGSYVFTTEINNRYVTVRINGDVAFQGGDVPLTIPRTDANVIDLTFVPFWLKGIVPTSQPAGSSFSFIIKYLEVMVTP